MKWNKKMAMAKIFIKIKLNTMAEVLIYIWRKMAEIINQK